MTLLHSQTQRHMIMCVIKILRPINANRKKKCLPWSNLSLDAMKSGLDIKQGQTVLNITDKNQTYLSG